MRRFLSELRNVAQSEAPVLIWGEPGAGKERAAQALHALSPRRDQPFSIVRCLGLDGATLRDTLEPILVPGNSGSLLLDGIEALDATAQVELLRELYRMPAWNAPLPRGRPAPRLISNAAVDLDALVRRGRLRRDLYHRLAVVRLHLPPLRTRDQDLPVLAADLLADPAREGASSPILEEDALAVLCGYPWPGNVRELAAVLTQAAWRAPDGRLRSVDLGDLIGRAAKDATVQIPLGTPLQSAVRTLIEATLAAYGHNKKRSAEALGISRRTLYLKLARS
jgi:two-component system response regulator HydG